METNLTIKNFRVFDEDGVSIDLKPITILTGCNSSGKSSLTKAVSLLNSFLKQIKKDVDNREPINLAKYRLDFTPYPNSLLGNFNRVVHEGSSNREVTFEYTVYSRMLATNVTVQLVFTNDENDQLNNGWLKRMSMSTSEGQFFSTDKENGSICNINLLKDAGIDFMIAEYLVDCYRRLVGAYDCEHSITKEEFETQKSLIKSELNKCGKDYKKDVCAYVRTTNNDKPIIVRCNANPSIVLWSKENPSLYMIPIIEDLNKLNKNEVKDWLIEKGVFSRIKGLKTYTNIIIDDFVASEHTCFGDYFKHYETLFLEKYKSYKLLSLKEPSLMDLGWAEETDFESVKEINFKYLYESIMLLNGQLYEQKTDYYEKSNERYEYNHFMIDRLFHLYVNEMIKEVLTPEWSDNMEYASSSRAKIQRLYSLDVDDDFTRLIKNYFDQKREFENETDIRHKDSKYKPDSFLNKWIRELGIGSKIVLESFAAGLGISIRLYKTEDGEEVDAIKKIQKIKQILSTDEKERVALMKLQDIKQTVENDESSHLLADEGYGITQLFTVLLQIETAILSARGERDNGSYGLDNLGGQQTRFNYEVNTILIEEPEIHLHPNFQSMLADMMVDAYKNYNIHFIVETHSEYLIRKLQVLVAGKVDETDVKINNDEISLLYVDASREKGIDEPQVKRIEICEDGYLDDTFGEGFFDEATKWSKKLIF